MSLEFTRTGGNRSSVHLCWLAQRTALPIEDPECLILDPPFQRGAVWTLAQKRAWIYSLLDDLPLPGIFINRFVSHPKYGHKEVVIDGQQRLRATAGFLRDEFSVRGEKWSEQDAEFTRVFRMSVTAPVIYTDYKTEAECAALYLKLLTSGTAHTHQDIEKAKMFLDSQ